MFNKIKDYGILAFQGLVLGTAMYAGMRIVDFASAKITKFRLNRKSKKAQESK